MTIHYKAEEIARQQLAERLADGQRHYIPPTIRVAVDGKEVLVYVHYILIDLGARKADLLNYYILGDSQP